MKPLDSRKKEQRYERIVKQIKDLLVKTDQPIPRMATIAAILHHKMEHFFWTGFYLIVDGELLVGPYQGSVACQVLAKNVGVCWSAINSAKSIVVADVHQFPGHIACDSRSNSEIVIPLRDKKGLIVGCLDIDSQELNRFDSVDEFYLYQIANLVHSYHNETTI